MPEWKSRRLEDVVQLKRGFDLATRERRQGPYPVVGSAGVSGWHDEGPIPGPALVLGRAGASMGVASYYEVEWFWPLNTALFVEDFKGNDPRFIFHLFQITDLTGFNSGSVQPMLNRNYIRNVNIRIPELNEQRAISGVLQALDDKIIVSDRIARTYEQLLRARFEELRIDEDPDSSYAMAVSEIIEFNPTLRIPRVGDAVYLDMAAVPTDRATILEWSRREPRSGTRFANGDTVIARITPCLENGKTAFIDFMKDGEVGIGSTEFIVMRARPGTPQSLPYFLARSPRFRTYAVQNMVGSSGRQRVNATQLVGFPIRQPDGESLSTFGVVANKALAHMRSLGDESRYLSELRDALLPRLMSGEIRVRDAEKVVEDVT